MAHDSPAAPRPKRRSSLTPGLRPLAALIGLLVAISPSRAQTTASRVNLTGTVVVVNPQADSVSLIDLKRMEAYRHVPVVGTAARSS